MAGLIDDDVDVQEYDEGVDDLGDGHDVFAAAFQAEAAQRVDEARQEVSLVPSADIFSVNPVAESLPLRFSILSQLVVESGYAAVVTTNSTAVELVVLNQSQSSQVLQFQKEKIRRVFLDPLGFHLIITTDKGETYYYHRNMKASKGLPPKLQSKAPLNVESVGWNRALGSDLTTGPILLGCAQGKVFEAVLSEKERTVRQVIDLKNGVEHYDTSVDTLAVVGIEFVLYTGSASDTAPRVFIMMVTPNRSFQFAGTGTFEEVFASYNDRVLDYHEMPSRDTPEGTRGKFVFSRTNPLHERPDSFVWLLSSGIYQGRLSFGSDQAADHVVTDCSLIALDDVVPPLDMIVTPYHYVLLYPTCIRVLSRVTKQLVQEIQECPRGMLHFAFDEEMDTLYLVLQSSLRRMSAINEDRNEWRWLLAKKDFEGALRMAKSDQVRNCVLVAHADALFAAASFQVAARKYAESDRPIEAVSLKFLQARELAGLREYLTIKLEMMPRSQDRTVQRVTLAEWLVELYLNSISELEISMGDRAAKLREQFHEFLATFKDDLPTDITYALISSYGCTDDMLFYADLMNDMDVVLGHYWQMQKIDMVLSTLRSKQIPELFYKFVPMIISSDPSSTVKELMQRGEKSVERPYIVKYLEYATQRLGCHDAAVINFLLTQYVDDKNEDAVIAFVRSQPIDGNAFDLKYGLRLCHQANLHRACVHIYRKMGLLDEAVDLALEISNVDLAKMCAGDSGDTDSRKRLWRRIARHVVTRAKEAPERKAAIAILSECSALKIEDVLPYFPDEVLIDDFKDELCALLREYNHNIQQLKTNMDEATASAERIRVDLKRLRDRSGEILVTQRCEMCDQAALSRAFYLFPCKHAFHADCLAAQLRDSVNLSEVHELREKIQFLQSRRDRAAASSGVYDNEALRHLDTLSAQLDERVARECPLCGAYLLSTLDKPFVVPEDLALELDWSVSR